PPRFASGGPAPWRQTCRPSGTIRNEVGRTSPIRNRACRETASSGVHGLCHWCGWTFAGFKEQQRASSHAPGETGSGAGVVLGRAGPGHGAQRCASATPQASATEASRAAPTATRREQAVRLSRAAVGIRRATAVTGLAAACGSSGSSGFRAVNLLDSLPGLILLYTVFALPIYVTYLIGQHSSDWGAIIAASTRYTIPPILFFLLVQGQMARGLVAGAVEG